MQALTPSPREVAVGLGVHFIEGYVTVIDTFSAHRQIIDETDYRGASICVESRGTTTVISVAGDIDACNADFMSVVLKGFGDRSDRVAVDLSGCDFVGLPGLRVLIAFDDERRRNDKSWTLVPCPVLRRLIEVVDVGSRLPIADSVGDAMSPSRSDTVGPDSQEFPRVAEEKLRC